MGSWGHVNWGLVVVELSFVLDKVCDVFHGYLMYVFHEFLTSRGGNLSFSRASSDCLCTAPRTPAVTVTRALIFHLAFFNISMRLFCSLPFCVAIFGTLSW